MKTFLVWLALAAGTAACTGERDEDSATADSLALAAYGDTASAFGGYASLTPEEIEADRMDSAWRRVTAPDTTIALKAGTNPETWEEISATTVNGQPMHLPLGGDVAGPSVLRVQVLLDRARFSPGILDGKWGKNTEKAVYWFQKREGLPASGTVDEQTFQRLMKRAQDPDSLVAAHRLTEADVAGPFHEIPEDIYEKAELDRMVYASLTEKLAERFHSSPALLERLNQEIDLDSLRAGQTLFVPSVEPFDLSHTDSTTGGPAVARLVVSDGGHYVHALDDQGRIVYHFPSTLGSSYDPSPSGEFEVTSITEDPWWHYQPELLADVDDSEEDARIPPGPNNAVGVVWMALSKPHYGIHGTSAPETIGYVTSAGCVRLTNWDALFLARRLQSGTPVAFRDT